MRTFMGRIRQQLHALCLYGLPVTLLPPRTAMEAWRVSSHGERYRHRPWPIRMLLACVMLTGYPVAVAFASVRSFRHLRTRHPSLAGTQLFLMYTSAILRNVPPIEYAYYRFDQPDKRALMPQYLFWTDTPALTRLNRLRGARNADVQDKARFAALCEHHGVPHVTSLVVTRGGKQVYGVAVEHLQPRRYWIKPLTGHAGAGSLGWDYDGTTWRSRERALSPAQWRSYLLSQDHVVQIRQENHPELQVLTDGGIITVRLTTVCSRTAEVHLIGSTAALPCGSDQPAGDAIACRINLHTGAIDRALGSGNVPVAVHPDSGVEICGTVLPCWQECVRLVLEAHRTAFTSFASLGWDVVITPSGPLLLETNSGWNPLGQQFNFGPLGLSALGPIVSEELRLSR